MRLSSKLYLGFAVVVFLAAVQAASSLMSLNTAASQARDLDAVHLPELALVAQINQKTALAGYHMRAYFFSFNPSDYEKGVAVLNELDALQGETAKLVEKNPDELSRLGELVEKFGSTLDSYRTISAKIHDHFGKIHEVRAGLAEESEKFAAAVAEMRRIFKDDYDTEKKRYDEDFSQKTADQLAYRFGRIAALDAIESEMREEMVKLWRGLARGDTVVSLENAVKGMAGIVEKAQQLLSATVQEKNREAAKALFNSVERVTAQLADYKTANDGIKNQGDLRVGVYTTLLELASETAKAGNETATNAAKKTNEWASFGLKLQIICMVVMLLAAITASLIIVRAVTGPLNRIITGLGESSAQVASAADAISGRRRSSPKGRPSRPRRWKRLRRHWSRWPP